MAKIKVVIVEYLEEVVEGLSIFMQHDDTIQLMAAYRNAEAALLEIPLLSPDIVIMYINLPGMSGIECVRQLSRQKPDIQFMMFTVYENNDQVFEALKAGASGYLLKKTSPARIVYAIKDLHNGGSPMSATIARKLVEVFNNQPPGNYAAGSSALLTSRENEVLHFVSGGLFYKEIADQLNLSFHTVKQHIPNIYEKLPVQNKPKLLTRLLEVHIDYYLQFFPACIHQSLDNCWQKSILRLRIKYSACSACFKIFNPKGILCGGFEIYRITLPCK